MTKLNIGDTLLLEIIKVLIWFVVRDREIRVGCNYNKHSTAEAVERENTQNVKKYTPSKDSLMDFAKNVTNLFDIHDKPYTGGTVEGIRG